LRATEPAIATRGTCEVDLFGLSQSAGVACLLLKEDDYWRIETDIAIVENLEVFLHFEKLHSRQVVALYAGGRLSSRALNWLASNVMSGALLLHCGDYDPVGLDEFLRLYNRVGRGTATACGHGIAQFVGPGARGARPLPGGLLLQQALDFSLHENEPGMTSMPRQDRIVRQAPQCLRP